MERKAKKDKERETESADEWKDRGGTPLTWVDTRKAADAVTHTDLPPTETAAISVTPP